MTKGLPMNRILVAMAFPAVAFAGLLAGCGGSDTAEAPAERQSAAAGDTRTCPPRNPSFTYNATIANTLPFPIMLRASEYDCNDWDGVSTPGRSFTGKVIKPGEKREFILQPVKYTTRNWTMEFLGESGSPSYGKVRLTIPQTGLSEDRIEVLGATRGYRPPEQTGGGPDSCDFLPLEPVSAPDTLWTKIDWFWKVPITLVARDGRFTVASECSTGGPA